MNNTDIDIELLDPAVGHMEVVQYEQKNPFFVSIEGTAYKYAKFKSLLDEFKYVYVICRKSGLSELTDTNQTDQLEQFFYPDASISQLNAVAHMVTLVAVPLSVTHVRSIRAGLTVIGKELLIMFNHSKYELADKELIVLMLEVDETMVKEWAESYMRETTIDSFIRMKIFSSYYKLDDRVMKEKLISLISQTGDCHYWTDPHNCILNNTEDFEKRKFNIAMSSKWGKSTQKVDDELKKLTMNFQEKKVLSKKVASNYPNQITNPANTKETDTAIDSVGGISSLSRLYTKKSYYELIDATTLPVKSEHIEELLTGRSLSEKEKFYLMANLLVSKKYCHLLLKNVNIMTATQPLWEKFNPVFRYLFGYAWASLCMDESIRKRKTTTDDRFVFNLEQASLLPSFPMCSTDPYLNPYFMPMVSEEALKLDRNVASVKHTFDSSNQIIDMPEFTRRFNIWVSGDARFNVFEGVNWEHMAVTGGCMAAILPKTNPLMKLFSTSANPTDPELNRFFQEYYANSDLDIECNYTNLIDFIKQVRHLKEVLLKNLTKYIPSRKNDLPTTTPSKSEDTNTNGTKGKSAAKKAPVKKSAQKKDKDNASPPSETPAPVSRPVSASDIDIEIKPIKTLSMIVNKKKLIEKCAKKEIPFEYNYIMQNKDSNEVRFYFYEKYLDQKKDMNRKNKDVLGNLINDPFYFKIINPVAFDDITVTFIDFVADYDTTKKNIEREQSESSIQTYITVFDPEDTVKSNTESFDDSHAYFKFTEILKYKLSSKFLNHQIEIFNIFTEHFFHSVGNFHLPCVRSYYNGKTCYLVPSAISAYKTRTNQNFKYFIGSKDPIFILLKYILRGYTTCSNDTEINYILAYILSKEHIRKAYGISDEKDIKSIIGALGIDHHLFKPRKNTPEVFVPDPTIKLDYKTSDPTYLTNAADIVKYYNTKYPSYSSEFIKMKTIDSNGNISPLKRWMIDAGYDMLGESNDTPKN